MVSPPAPTSTTSTHQADPSASLAPPLPAAHGYRCYINFALSLDTPGRPPGHVGLEIFIDNTEIEPSFSLFITTTLQEVLMVESTALALATSFCRKMGLQHINFFTDNQLLANCINGENPSDPPDWRIRTFTQTIVSSL
jgi:ribonuclease HI